jgi:membrane protein implicated in regulation of membrane protease activity
MKTEKKRVSAWLRSQANKAKKGLAAIKSFFNKEETQAALIKLGQTLIAIAISLGVMILGIGIANAGGAWVLLGYILYLIGYVNLFVTVFLATATIADTIAKKVLHRREARQQEEDSATQNTPAIEGEYRVAEEEAEGINV